MDRDEIKTILKLNLKKLCSAKGITQQELGEILDVSGKSTISNYLNKDEPSIPDIVSLYRLKEHYGFPLDSLLSPSFDPQNSFEIDGIDISQYNKFLGVYSLYYISSNKISPLPNEFNKPTLSYGVLAIVKDSGGNSDASDSAFHAYACFSLKTIESVEELKQKATEAFLKEDVTAVRNVFASRDRFSEGNFELIFKGNYYSLTLTGYTVQRNELYKNMERRTKSDKIMFLGFNPPNTSLDTSSYIGGGLLCSSISRGLNKCPCSQLVLASRKSITDDLPDLTLKLQRHHQWFNTDKVAGNIMARLEQLKNVDYSEDDKNILLSSFIKTSITNELNDTVSQLFYIFDTEDQIFYEFLKLCQ